ncbi:Hypothetical protein FKW44_001700 [Caligus rogercresseyi]|uniref:Uncharacterized protein n=1 Tax=Caligus rogercresseyi TaxID=217165 RepID=A0A7T8KJ62_CALRO|nr:Hypothetical protein FKW44_001700 [Caligus rogercresseyi]
MIFYICYAQLFIDILIPGRIFHSDTYWRRATRNFWHFFTVIIHLQHFFMCLSTSSTSS